MKRLLTKLAFLIVLVVFAKTASAQIIRINLSIDQPNIEDCVTSIETNFQLGNIKVFPNPTKGLFTVTIDNSIVVGQLKMSIYNVNSQEVYTEKLYIDHTRLEKNIDLSGYPSGIYLFNINSKEKYYKAKIILK
ncbi:MAG TPA: T9SS type A sorting domain-containing protein [Prolixibacteraceae bacterium]|nr:T9SS type A sorting domain-containing protein [Prolixibacteraceae bacterium]